MFTKMKKTTMPSKARTVFQNTVINQKLKQNQNSWPRFLFVTSQRKRKSHVLQQIYFHRILIC